MKRLMKKIEDIMVAITFAEVGEYEAARQLAAPETHAEEKEEKEEAASEGA